MIEDVIRDEKLREITNVISDKSTQKNINNSGNNRWSDNVQQTDEKPTRDTDNLKAKRPQSLSILTTTTTSSSSTTKSCNKNERGDPDGDCGMEEEMPILMNNAELRLSAQDILNSKKGWLMKLDPTTGVWSKYWFCLKGGGLFYYRDPSAEKRGVLDGVLDVNSIIEIQEISSSNRDHAFQLKVSFLIFFCLIW